MIHEAIPVVLWSAQFAPRHQLAAVQRLCDTMTQTGEEPAIVTHLPAPGWRNWQTQRTQNPPDFGPWGFDSPSRHHNEQTLFKGGGWDLIQDLRQQKQISDFLVVTPDGMRSFYINSADGRVRYSDFFVREFIPYIEAHYSIRRERSARAISGVSMGGYGALRFAFAHPELFSSVSAQSAAIITASPRETTAAVYSGTPLGRMLGAAFGNPIDASHWEQNSLFVLAKQNRVRIAGLSIYFNCGREDEFGFENGAAELHRQLQAEGIKHEFHLYPGDHGATYFLAHLGEILRFHSRVFAPEK